MKLSAYYSLIQANEDKIPIIDQITARHPAIGVDLGWSSYIGGMADSGEWFIEALLSVPIQTLRNQEEQWEREEIESKKRQEEYNKLTLQERMELEIKAHKEFIQEWERRMMWGK